MGCGGTPLLEGGGYRYWSNKNQRIKFTLGKRHSKLSFRFPPLRSGWEGGGEEEETLRATLYPPLHSGTEYLEIRTESNSRKRIKNPEIILASRERVGHRRLNGNEAATLDLPPLSRDKYDEGAGQGARVRVSVADGWQKWMQKRTFTRVDDTLNISVWLCVHTHDCIYIYIYIKLEIYLVNSRADTTRKRGARKRGGRRALKKEERRRNANTKMEKDGGRWWGEGEKEREREEG